jgi:nucleoid DNA-binding protein
VIKLIRDNEVKNMIDKMRFIKLFRKRLFKKLRKKYISFEMSNYTYKVMKEEIEKVYDKINNFEYNPDPAIQNILFAKSAYNYREIVDLNPIDEYLYWFLAVEIIKDAPNLRVEHTFGRYIENNPMKKQEKKEHSSVRPRPINDDGYSNDYDYDADWRREYNAYRECIYANCMDSKYINVLYFDIANFYDCISIPRLENELYKVLMSYKNEEVRKAKNDYVRILIDFFERWNIKKRKYVPLQVGIPQSTFGEASRIMAHIYLLEFDNFAHDLCEDNNAVYFRYADDISVLISEETDIELIITELNEKIREIGLNFNAKSVLFDKEKYLKNRLFREIDAVKKRTNVEALSEIIETVFKMYDNDKNVRVDSFAKFIFKSRKIREGLDSEEQYRFQKVFDWFFESNVILKYNAEDIIETLRFFCRNLADEWNIWILKEPS